MENPTVVAPVRGARAPESARLVGRWIVLVSAGEAAGFLAPIAAGVVVAASEVPALAGLLLLVVAGGVEGAMLGAAQSTAILGRPHRRWVGASSAGAAAAWLLGMLPSTLGLPSAPSIRLTVVVVGAILMLLVLPCAQWMVVRRTPRSLRWVGWNVLAWTLGLLWTFAPSPFIDEYTPVAVLVGCYTLAGLLMAATVALVTASAAVRLLPAALAPPRPAPTR